MVRSSQRKEMADWAVRNRSASIAQACRTFSISETCYRYQPKLSDENELIADWLIALRVDRSMVRYQSRRADDKELRDAIKRVSKERRRFG